MNDSAVSGDAPEPSDPRHVKTKFAAVIRWLENHAQLVAAFLSFGTVVLLALQTWQVGEQTRVSSENVARQIDQAVYTVNFQEFIHCIEQLEDVLSATQQVDNYSAFEPIVVIAKGDSLLLRLDGGSESYLVLDESESDPVVRLQLRGSIAICRPTGGSEPAFQAAASPERYLSYFQRARKLEQTLGDAVVSSQYLTLARFGFAYSGFEEAERFLNQAVECTEKSEDGPGKAMMLAQIAAIRVKYQRGGMADEGRALFREAVNVLQGRQSASSTVSLVNVYQAWAEAEYRAENIGLAKDVTQRLFQAIDRLPVKQTIKNQHIVDAAAAILIEMELASDLIAEMPLPEAFRFATTDGEWKSPSIAEVKNSLNTFHHSRISPVD